MVLDLERSYVSVQSAAERAGTRNDGRLRRQLEDPKFKAFMNLHLLSFAALLWRPSPQTGYGLLRDECQEKNND